MYLLIKVMTKKTHQPTKFVSNQTSINQYKIQLVVTLV